MMGLSTGTIQKMPKKGRRGQIVSDDGTLFTFSLPMEPKQRLQLGGRVRFVAGSRNTARAVKLSLTSHSNVGKP